MEKLSKVEIWTDGSCSPNPGNGGWAFRVPLLDYNEYGGLKDTTNNRMELTAALQAMRWSNQNQPYVPCTIYSDSMYLINAFNKKWIYGWEKKGWSRSDKVKNLVNVDLWMKLLTEFRKGSFTLVWVKGHYFDQENITVDALANRGRNERCLQKDVYLAPVGLKVVEPPQPVAVFCQCCGQILPKKS